jgi:ABC-type uncharacterized transport system ATPase subunit
MPARAAIAQSPRLALRGISKRYGDLLANDRVDLTVLGGQVHAVLGENGAGKSTLMKIIYGVTQPDAGRIDWEGAPVVIGSPARARRLGIGMVFQHFSLFETLTVAENIALALDERIPMNELVARIGLRHAVDDLHQRALAGTVLTQHGTGAAPRHRHGVPAFLAVRDADRGREHCVGVG